jgi:hypothetical protein
MCLFCTKFIWRTMVSNSQLLACVLMKLFCPCSNQFDCRVRNLYRFCRFKSVHFGQIHKNCHFDNTACLILWSIWYQWIVGCKLVKSSSLPILGKPVSNVILTVLYNKSNNFWTLCGPHLDSFWTTFEHFWSFCGHPLDNIEWLICNVSIRIKSHQNQQYTNFTHTLEYTIPDYESILGLYLVSRNSVMYCYYASSYTSK